MICNIEDIKKDVRVLMDKYPDSRPLLDVGDVDSISVDAIIEHRIADAARIVENSAPSYRLDSGITFGSAVSWDGQLPGYGSGHIELPNDFLRLVTFQMSDWSRPVTAAITEEDPTYSQQFSRFAGIKGNPEKPVVAIVQYPIGLVLEFFSCKGGAGVTVKRARYIPIPKLEDGSIEICEMLRPSILYMCASLVCAELGEAQVSDQLLKISNELMK